MTTYHDLDAEDQLLLRRSLQAAAVAVSAASLGRAEETASEGFAAAKFVLEGRAAYVGNALVSSVILELEDRIHAEQPFPDYTAAATAPGAFEAALETLRAVSALLDARATRAEAAGYREWLNHIAAVVAAAGREDQGFLGRGGVQINAAERDALDVIANALRPQPT
jgi:hypothetical protein